jgi:hypothetical protein
LIRGLVDEDETGRLQPGLLLTSSLARGGDVRPLLLGRPQRLF